MSASSSDSMAQKRTAQEAFGHGKGQLSAFAAAKLARESKTQTKVNPSVPGGREVDALTDIVDESYDENRSDSSLPSIAPAEVEVAPIARANIVQLSTFRPSASNVVDDSEENLEIELGLNETATFFGEYNLTVTSGLITIYGSVLRPTYGPQRICAPSSHALPQIQARQKGTRIRIASIKVGLRSLESLSPIFRNIWSGTDRSFRLTASSYDEADQRLLSGLDVDPDIDAVCRILSAKVETEPRRPRVMAIGAKSSGKSTLNRIIGNHLHSWTSIKKYLYMDLDPGQPEFGPPGQISLVQVTAPLLGPSFARTASSTSPDFQIVRMHSVAATSFKDDPEHYKQCALDLIRHANPRLPLIINSCGWVSGLGAVVLTELVPLLSVTDIVLLEPIDPSLRDSLRTDNKTIAFHTISRRAARPSPRTPAELRAMQTMAYFHTKPVSSSHHHQTPQFLSKPLTRTRHWTIHFSGICAIASYGPQPHPDFLCEVLDGSLVAIVLLDDNESSEDPAFPCKDQILHTEAEGLPYWTPDAQGESRTLNPRHSHCVGLALVRGINTDSKCLHLITPIPESEFSRVVGGGEEEGGGGRGGIVVLVRGSFDAPEWAYVEDLHWMKARGGNCGEAAEEEVERPWVSEREMVGIEGAVWRLRHPPTAAAAAMGVSRM